MNNQPKTLSLNNLVYTLLFIIILLALVYINETSSLSTQGYVLADYQNELKEVEQNKISMQTEIAKKGSIIALNENASQNSMEKSNPIYINHTDAIVKN